MDKKYQVFISSTYTDLIPARQKVTNTILSLTHFPAGMEMFSAGDDGQWTVIQATIDNSDYYILILGHRYGSVTDEGISYTEKEYDYAFAKGIPIMSFIMNRDAATKPSEREDKPAKRKRLEKFVEKAKAGKMVDFWDTPDELAAKVSIALTKAFSTHPRIGWVRGDQAASPKIMDELVELNRENRQLKTELEGIKKLATKQPAIQLEINSGESLKLCCYQKVDYPRINPPQPIESDAVPKHLMKYIKEGAIEAYNEAVPDEASRVQKYNRQSEFYARLKLSGIDLDLSVLNTGECKANNVLIEIDFPKEVKVVKGGLEAFEEPTAPALLTNPVQKADSEYLSEKMGLGGVQRLAAIYNTPWGGLNSFDSGVLRRDFFDNLPNANRNFYSSLEGNTLTIYCKDLLHTRRKTCKESYMIIPYKPGEFEIKVSIICEEYSSRDEYKIPLTIE